jgi:hypothetical protein
VRSTKRRPSSTSWVMVASTRWGWCSGTARSAGSRPCRGRREAASCDGQRLTTAEGAAGPRAAYRVAPSENTSDAGVALRLVGVDARLRVQLRDGDLQAQPLVVRPPDLARAAHAKPGRAARTARRPPGQAGSSVGSSGWSAGHAQDAPVPPPLRARVRPPDPTSSGSPGADAERPGCRTASGPLVCRGDPASGHLLILVTRPAPTVRPPSRMAKRRPSSMAMGWMSSTDISVLSPGMTISVPSGRCTTPVTSVVRK